MRRAEANPATMNLLFAVFPLLRLKSRRMSLVRAAWIEAAHGAAEQLIKADGIPTALTRAEAARAIFDLAMDAADVAGVARVDVAAWFNERGEAGARVTEPEAAIERGLAYFLALAASDQAARADAQERESTEEGDAA